MYRYRSIGATLLSRIRRPRFFLEPHMHKLPSLLIASVILAACTTPLCPHNMVQHGHTCSLCPEGSEKRLNKCVMLDGGVVVEAVGAGDGGMDSDPDDQSDDAGIGPTINGMDSSISEDAASGEGTDASATIDKDATPTVTFSDASSTPEASTPDTGLASLDAATDAGPSYTGLPQQTYLKASNSEASDQFGTAIALSKTTLVVGAPGEDSSANMINGNELDESAPNTGAAYVFVRSGNQWIQQAYLKPNQKTPAIQHFGKSVAIVDDAIAIGSDDGVWLFSRTQAQGETLRWSVAVFHLPSDQMELNPNAGFGTSVAVATNTLVVGAPSARRYLGESSALGSVFVFTLSNGTWQQTARFLGETGFNGSPIRDISFGAQVSISAYDIAIGAPTDWHGSKGVNPTGESIVNNSGAVFLYVGSGSNWSQNAFIKASNTDAEDRFGSALSMDRDTLAVGAPGEASAGSSEQDNGAPNAGAVYAFARTSGIWSQQAFLKTQNPKAGDRFGASVSLLGEVMAVGAPGADAGAGRVYLLRRFGAVWSHQTLMEAARRDANDSFGAAVAVSEDRIVVSATGEGSNARGVMATLVEQADNTAPGSGAVYSFARP